MREIKFRAWDNDDKVMRSWDELHLIKHKNDDFYLLGYEVNKVITNYDHEQILLQYTGLQDKNGTDIYEGDILEWNPSIRKEISKVEFDEGGFVSGGYFLQADLQESINGNIKLSTASVMGNIYENPELLEVSE